MKLGRLRVCVSGYGPIGNSQLVSTLEVLIESYLGKLNVLGLPVSLGEPERVATLSPCQIDDIADWKIS